MSDITFLASVPDIQSAIKIGRDGARLQLDIPRTEMDAIRQLPDLTEKLLSVAIVVMGDTPKHDGKPHE